jgi:site-specific DNA-methyltransferase (adenine-specific)
MQIRDRIKELRRVKASTLIPHDLNYRKHPTRQKTLLKQLLGEVGYADALIAYETPQGLRLIDGHLRAETTPDQLVPVLVLDVDEREANKLLLTMDPLAGLAETDATLLDSLLRQADVTGDLAAWLSERAEADVPLSVEPAPPASSGLHDELLAKWSPERGQVWALGRHRLACGDSSDRALVSRLVGDRKADAMITDPPYGVSYKGKTGDALEIISDDLDDAGLASLCESVFSVAADVACRPGAYWYATVPARPLHLVFASDWKRRGVLRQIMVWVKNAMVLGVSEYHYRHEPILFGWLPGGQRRPNGDRTRTTVWEHDKPAASREHPTMKPVSLWRQAIEDSTSPGDVVFDPFLGSGTTILASEQSGRTGLGVELDLRFCAVILERWVASGGASPVLQE